MITKDINKAAEALRNNDVVAIPTETVYGLAGNVFSEVAIQKIYALKQRPLFNPLIVHLKSIEQLGEVATDIPAKAIQLAQAFWPGPLTLVLKKQPHIPDLVTSGKDTVAVRVPAHPVALRLLEALEFPLAAPSANPFGLLSPTSAAHVENDFQDALNVILDGGECQKGIESTIIGFENGQPVLYRPGAIPLGEIEKVIGSVQTLKKEDKQVKAPGMLDKHYAPKTTTYLTDNMEGALAKFPDQKIGLLLFNHKMANAGDNLTQEILSGTGDLEEAAQNLYAALHRLDKHRLDVIIMEKLPNVGLGVSINDRMQKAAKESV